MYDPNRTKPKPLHTTEPWQGYGVGAPLPEATDEAEAERRPAAASSAAWTSGVHEREVPWSGHEFDDGDDPDGVNRDHPDYPWCERCDGTGHIEEAASECWECHGTGHFA